ncbi:MAG TPA: class I SAM-dependent methyltransferase [Terriglobales bacterium]|nr:class I SAM-dependent methyltransferase [Terriglobales bacterium]
MANPGSNVGSKEKLHFGPVSGGYAAFRPTYPPELLEYLGGLPQQRNVAWDVGCGSGQLSLPLAQHFKQVIATDASPEQVAKAQSHERIRYGVGSAEASNIPPDSVDLVVAAQAAHWFDLQRFYNEVRRVGRPGSIVALISYGNLEMDGFLHDLIRVFTFATLKDHWPAERNFVNDGYASLLFPFEERQPPPLAIVKNLSREALLGYIHTWSSVSDLRRKGKAENLTKFEAQLKELWGEEKEREVRWPISMRVGNIR